MHMWSLCFIDLYLLKICIFNAMCCSFLIYPTLHMFCSIRHVSHLLTRQVNVLRAKHMWATPFFLLSTLHGGIKLCCVCFALFCSVYHVRHLLVLTGQRATRKVVHTCFTHSTLTGRKQEVTNMTNKT